MTPAEQALTYHLATVVCGARRYEDIPGRWWWGFPSGVYVFTFEPIHRPADTAMVMEAWRIGEHTLLLDLDNASRTYTATADYGEDNCGASDPTVSWTEAVCRAIEAASEFVGEGK